LICFLVAEVGACAARYAAASNWQKLASSAAGG